MSKQVIEAKALIFDWSGVISDDRYPVYRANVLLWEELKLPILTFEQWLPTTTLTVNDWFKERKIDVDLEWIRKRYKENFDRINQLGIIPDQYPDAVPVMDYLKSRGKSLAVLSSHPSENLNNECRRYGLDKHFTSVQGCAREKIEGIKAILEKLKTSPQEALYIGDTIYDIRAAKQAGTKSAGITTGYHTKERLFAENPDLLLANLSDLRNGTII